MPDDKFLDYFINLSEEIAPGRSKYFVESDESSLKLVTSGLAEAFTISPESIQRLSRTINSSKIVYFHSFKAFHSSLIELIEPSVEVNWVFWGAEGYQIYHLKNTIHLPATKKYLQAELGADAVSPKGLFKKYRADWALRRKSRIAAQVVKRANYCCSWIKGDFELMKGINPNLRFKFFTYYSIEQLGLDKLDREEGDRSIIWLGNSADPSNNHLDALLELKKQNWRGEIIVPLSYNGTESYRTHIISVGRQLFGDKFQPILDFISKEEYHRLMNKCGIVWMNHVRQQAAGNCFAALWMGKRLVLRPESTLTKQLEDWGLDFSHSISQLVQPDVNKNRTILQSQISFEKVKERIRSYYNLS